MPLSVPSAYPVRSRDRDAWIFARRADVDRSARAGLDPYRPYSFFVEDERGEDGQVAPVATLFLTNRECPWRCLMCDLWRNTLDETVPRGALPAQVDYALSRLPPARRIKLYNSGSFFDPRAVPVEDHAAIASRLGAFERVIVECHPALVDDRCVGLRDLLRRHGDIRLEVAMGLETAHPQVLERLNKRMTLDLFARAADFLRQNGIALRVFILVRPPFLDEAEALGWAERSLDFAFDCGATAAVLIPTRSGNGALEVLAEAGTFAPPRLATLEAVAGYGIRLGRGRTFADLWDLARLSICPHSFASRAERLRTMNLKQTVPKPLVCPYCGGDC